jgi:hypothetical protein
LDVVIEPLSFNPSTLELISSFFKPIKFSIACLTEFFNNMFGILNLLI